MVKHVTTIQQFDELLKSNDPFVFLKHSTTCPISAAAYTEFQAFASSFENVPCYFLHVQDDRPLSNYIADQIGVRHESPQLFIFKDGKPVYHTSHFSIKKDAIQEALATK
jgi:bacillithiol system protein YtxJ